MYVMCYHFSLLSQRYILLYDALGADSRAASRDSGIRDVSHTSNGCLTDAKTLPGISQPFPEMFDPLNLLNNATSIQEVRRWR